MSNLVFRVARRVGMVNEKVRAQYNSWKLKEYLIRSGAMIDNFESFRIASSSVIYAAAKLKIGRGLTIGERTVIDSNDSVGIYIGKNLLAASDVFIRAGNHDWSFSDEPFQQRGHCAKRISFEGEEYSIVIEDNVWIGHGATIISGAHIGEGCVIGANAVVGSVPEGGGTLLTR